MLVASEACAARRRASASRRLRFISWTVFSIPRLASTSRKLGSGRCPRAKSMAGRGGLGMADGASVLRLLQ